MLSKNKSKKGWRPFGIQSVTFLAKTKRKKTKKHDHCGYFVRSFGSGSVYLSRLLCFLRFFTTARSPSTMSAIFVCFSRWTVNRESRTAVCEPYRFPVVFYERRYTIWPHFFEFLLPLFFFLSFKCRLRKKEEAKLLLSFSISFTLFTLSRKFVNQAYRHDKDGPLRTSGLRVTFPRSCVIIIPNWRIHVLTFPF